MPTHKVLSTKKLDASLTTKATEDGLIIIEQEFITTRTIHRQETLEQIKQLAEKGSKTIALTSSNAGEILNEFKSLKTEEWTVFCLSGKTKETVLRAELPNLNIIAKAGNAKELAESIITNRPQDVAFLCGNKRRRELPDLLKRAGVVVHEFTVYETLATPVKVKSEMDGILFFSPSAVESFFSLNQLEPHVICFVIGETTSDSLRRFTQNKIVISGVPGQEAMIRLASGYFKDRQEQRVMH
jgi:uroporphyrinogen-III synthase